MTTATETLRVRVEYDLSPYKPYDDGGSPILLVNNYGRRVEQDTSVTSYVADARVEDALTHFLTEFVTWKAFKVWERYLRIFHGGTKVLAKQRDDYVLVSYDTAEWREHIGLSDEYLAKHPDVNLVNVDDYLAWANGEVYVLILERETLWVSDRGQVRITWEQVEAIGGFYGLEDDDLRSAAAEQFDLPSDFELVTPW